MKSQLVFPKNLSIFKRGECGDIDFQAKNNLNIIIWLYLLFFAIGFFFIILIMRLFQLTVVKGNYYSRLATDNRVREILIEPRRGKIIDRKGFVIAQNNQVNVENKGERLLSKRIYEGGEAVVHIVGYRQIADADDLKNDNCLNRLQLGDKIGRKGIEKIFDCDLRGRPGKKLVEIDARGKIIRTINVVPPVDGKTVQLALDLDLQKKAYELIKGKRGAIAVIKPQTGEVLALASSPSFNPEDFENGNSSAITNYFQDKTKPLFNRAIEAAYPPGSIFKLVVAAAALEEEKINSQTIIEDNGSIKAGPLTFGNWYFLQYGKTEGPVDIFKAIQRSNDIFFYKVGEKTGPELIKIWAEKFGYGSITGIGMAENEGLIPSAFWKMENLKEKWYLGDTYNFSIGQGYVLATPLQTVMTTGAIANDGYLCKPMLVKSLKLKAESCQKIPISNENLEIIQEGMKKACAPGGTGWPLFEFGISLKQLKTVKTSLISTNKSNLISTDFNRFQPISVACKTGTAESHELSKIPHAWFTAYAPFDSLAGKPEIAVSVLLEEAGQGSDVAGPVVKEILKTYFERSE